MPKKKFFERKDIKAIFELGHRSQRDPLVADSNAPQHVLIPLPLPKSKTEKSPAKEVSSDEKVSNPITSNERKKEQAKYGIYFDDDYDYLQHLKGPETVTWIPIPKLTKAKHHNLMLPSSVFPSHVEENVGMLNKAAPVRGPRLDYDPDIVEALENPEVTFTLADEDKECEDGLEEDFFSKANEAASDEDDNSGDDDGDIFENEDDYYPRHDEVSFDEEETKSRFTNYSLTSSVLTRNKGLTLIDDRFERMYEEYDDEQIGALDEDDDDQCPTTTENEILENVIQEYHKQLEKSKVSLKDVRSELEAKVYGSSDEEMCEVAEDEPVDKWDCESILSTYSNLYNHPKIIPSKIEVKSSLPKNALRAKLTQEALNDFNNSVSNAEPKEMFNLRSQDETPEEKKNRKQAVKQQRRERRMEKKANSTAFKEEKKRQAHIMVNLKKNIQGLKLV